MFPPGAIFNEQGQGFHSWQTGLLPYLDASPIYSKINFRVPWDDPVNVPHFQKEYRAYCRASDEPKRNAEGWGISHWAANERVIFPNSSVRVRDITDGTANTIAAGEVFGNFSPWGRPGNWRDPAQGINKGPNSFGNPNFSNGQFLLLDGSVRTISENIDSETLRRLADPKDGQPVGEF